MIRVLMVEDNAIVRKSLRVLVEGIDQDIEIIGEARDGIEAVELTDQVEPDVVLMDIQMPRMNGLQATKEIHAHNPDVAIVILSNYDDQTLICQSVRNGAKGYVRKRDAFADLGPAIHTVCQGGTFFGPQIAAIQTECGETADGR